MHWKIRRDPYLRPLAERRGEDAVWASGFFFDEDDRDAPLDDVDWPCTPRPKLPVTGARPVALVTTGALCPVHAGHLAMMERARERCLAAGLDVIGGYLSPGHDAYVTMKCGAAAIPAPERLRLCAEAIEGSPWLSVDPWEALYRRVSVNFTDVAARLGAYLRARVDPRVEVVYVCGGDNARFALAFAERGACVVVGRPGADAERARWRDHLAGSPRALWADGDHTAASRELRAPVWTPPPRRRLVLRVEDRRAVRTLAAVDLARFQRRLRALFERYTTVREAPLGDACDEGDVISLDAMLPARTNLAVSRLYAVGGYEALGHVARPGARPLSEQLAAIAPGAYALRDDDRMTGATLAAVRAMLPEGVRVTSLRLSVEHDDDEDVADSRDLLLGADDGGLVIALPDGGVGRAPYALPYADPAARCSLAPEHAREFSERVWALNAEAFEGTSLRVRDLPPPAYATFRAMGDDRALADLCRWHLERLRATR